MSGIVIGALEIQGCHLVEPRVLCDVRGTFVKPFVQSAFEAHGLRTDFVEQYHSTSAPGVIRGMHFQRPPHAHAKLVYCAAGAVRDVLLDLRVRSPTRGRHLVVPLSAESGRAVYVPEGVAHGFVAISEPALMVYNVTSEYAPAHDDGVRWDSFGCDWNVHDPLLSARDRAFAALADFHSPF